MSKERKFHELIEQQNREEKDAVWAKIQQKEAEREKKELTPALPKTRLFFGRKWMQIAASSIVAVAIGVFATWGFLSLKNENSDDNKGRYFTGQAYETVEIQYTLKEYAQEIGKDLLYFDWYEETDHLKDRSWQLNDTQEIICFQEEIIDVNTGCKLEIFVMQAETEIQDFSLFEETNLISEVKGVRVDWKKDAFAAYANFEYEDYKYYLRVDEPIDENYILDLIEILLS